jgi:hypothetical protein
MTTKIAILATAGLFVVVMGLGCGGLWYMSQHRVPGVRLEDRASRLGAGMGVPTAVALAIIWGLWFKKRKDDRAEQDADERRARKRSQRKARQEVEDDESD